MSTKKMSALPTERERQRETERDRDRDRQRDRDRETEIVVLFSLSSHKLFARPSHPVRPITR